MSYTPRYDKGNWIADCDVCGRKFKASMLQQRWDGLMCCSDDWEIRQPQDFVRGVQDTQIAPWLRPEPTDSFIPVTIAQWLVSWVTSNTTLFVSRVRAKPIFIITSIVNAILVLRTTKGQKQINGAPINTKSLG